MSNTVQKGQVIFVVHSTTGSVKPVVVSHIESDLMTFTELNPRDTDEKIGQKFDRNNASFFDGAGNRVSGLCLDDIGLDGHEVANLLWKISAYLERRANGESEYLL